jgi:TatD DNase family protein
MLIDTHAHVNFGAFKEDAELTIKRALSEGVWVVNVGTQIDTSREAVAMAEKFESGVYAVVGIHPVHTYSQDLQEEETQFKTREEKFDYNMYRQLALNPKVVGIGECGLDYFRLPEINEGSGLRVDDIKKMQKEAFIEQLKLAKELNKALVIHSRSSQGTDDACLDILEILKTPSLWRHSERVQPSEESLRSKGGILHPSDALGVQDDALPRFVLHSYTGSPEVAQKFVELGGYVSFNGILTFDKTGNMEKVLAVVPDNRILLETDCPYLTPTPHRGKRNEPAYVKHVAKKVASLKKISPGEVADLTTENARRFFNV